MFGLTLSGTATRAAPRARPRSDLRPESATSPFASARQDAFEAAFRAWVAGTEKPDVLLVEGSGCVPMPIERVLQHLAMSTRPLDAASGAALGLHADATVGAAATALLRARTDPTGPRCRSYRSATYFLVGQARLSSDDERNASDGPTTRSTIPATGVQ